MATVVKPPQAIAKPDQGRRPIAIRVLAVIHMVVGGVGTLSIPIILFSTMVSASPASRQSLPGVYGSPVFHVALLVVTVVHAYVSVLLVAAGIGLWRLRPWAWHVSVGCACVALFLFVGTRGAIFISLFFQPTSGRVVVSLIAGSILMLAPQVLHPLATLIILGSQSARRRMGISYGMSGKGQGESPVVYWATPAYLARQRGPLLWVLLGPDMPPYVPRGERGSGWQWAILAGTVWIATSALFVTGMLTRFHPESLPVVLMALASLTLGPIALAAVFFQWGWFFNSRSARAMRWMVGDRSARWCYTGVAVLVITSGFALLGSHATRAVQGDLPYIRVGIGPPSSQPMPHQRGPNQAGVFSGHRSPLCGGKGGSPFERFGQEGPLEPGRHPVLGLRYQLGNWDNQDVIQTIHPLYDRAEADQGNVILAPPGYQVGAMEVDSNLYVNAVRIEFVPQNAGRIIATGIDAPQSAPDSQVGSSLAENSQAENSQAESSQAESSQAENLRSDWIGTPTGNPTHQLGRPEAMVVGIHGRQGLITNAIGLLWVE